MCIFLRSLIRRIIFFSRFAAYIERVRFLEADNKRLQSIITELTVKYDALDAALRAIYEEEMKAARQALDKTTAAKGAAELRVSRHWKWSIMKLRSVLTIRIFMNMKDESVTFLMSRRFHCIQAFLDHYVRRTFFNPNNAPEINAAANCVEFCMGSIGYTSL